MGIKMTEKRKEKIFSVILQLVCVLVGLVIIAPVLYCISAAFRTPRCFPADVTWITLSRR